MRAILLETGGQFALRDIAPPRPARGELLLSVECAGICASDLHLAHSGQSGLVLGHEFAGRIVGLGEGAGDGPDGFRIGERICGMPVIACGRCPACMMGEPLRCPDRKMIGMGGSGGAFAEQMLAGASTAFRLPDTVDDRCAAAVEPLAVGLQAVERAALPVGARVAVLGAGPIGLAVTLWLQALGARRVVVSDPLPSRRALATHIGAETVDPTAAGDVAEAIRATLGAEPDRVIECVGRPGMLAEAIRLVAPGGRVVIAGMHFGDETFQPKKALLKNVGIEFSTFYRPVHFAHTVDMMAQGRLDPRPMLNDEIGLEALPAMMETLARPNPHGKVQVSPQVPGSRTEA